MKDRYGHDIRIFWAEHEIEWVSAANTLDFLDRRAAFKDIASMSGRSYEAVRRFASDQRARDARQAKAWAEKKKLVSTNAPLAPTAIKPPSMARLMGCR